MQEQLTATHWFLLRNPDSRPRERTGWRGLAAWFPQCGVPRRWVLLLPLARLRRSWFLSFRFPVFPDLLRERDYAPDILLVTVDLGHQGTTKRTRRRLAIRCRSLPSHHATRPPGPGGIEAFT